MLSFLMFTQVEQVHLFHSNMYMKSTRVTLQVQACYAYVLAIYLNLVVNLRSPVIHIETDRDVYQSFLLTDLKDTYM